MSSEVFAAVWAASQRQHNANPRYPVDLYLACACAHGNKAALAVFERQFVGQVPGYITRYRLTPDQADEVMQTLRIRLFTGAAPKIATYTGTGPLGSWLRVTAVRIALEILESGGQTQNAGSDRLADLYADDQTGIRGLLERHRTRLKATIQESFESLSDRDRSLLKMHFIDGLNIDAIGLIYGVHRASVARWLCGVRDRVYENVCREFAIEFRSSSTELRSLVNHFERDFELSLCRILGEGPEPAVDIKRIKPGARGT